MGVTDVTSVSECYPDGYSDINYTEFYVDLNDYVGQTVYVAFRHLIPEGDEYFNCFLAIDMVEFFGTENSGPIIVDEIYVDGYEFPPMAGYESMNHLNLTTPEDAPYYVDFEWTNWYDEDAGWDFFDRFIGGTYYSVYTTIQLPEGYEFADEVTIYVNGYTELVSEYVYFYGDHMVFYTVPFLCHMWGDANGDGELTTVDTLLIMRYSLGIEELEEDLIDPWCDVNADGCWNFSDALLILRKVMEIIDFFPVECE